MVKKLPESTIERLSLIYEFCIKLKEKEILRISSAGIGEALGIPAHTIRKDLNYLGEIGDTGSGYDVPRLELHLAESLGFTIKRKACVVGLGRLGSALLEYSSFGPDTFSIEAGFDSSINRLETIKTKIPLFPAYEIPEIVRRKQIEMALLTVPAPVAGETAELLARGGIRGIINFAPTVVNPDPETVIVRNINVMNELRIISSRLFLMETETL